MKKLLIALPFVIALSAEAAAPLFVCEGKIGTQDITLLDDGYKAGIYKGKLNIAAGAHGNNFPVVIFEPNELNFAEVAEDCKLSATSESKGSFTVAAPCSGEGAGTITALSLPSIQLTAESVEVTCRLEELGQPERRQQPQRQDRPQEECVGSSYDPSCDEEE
jgi:hypothetical protein